MDPVAATANMNPECNTPRMALIAACAALFAVPALLATPVHGQSSSATPRPPGQFARPGDPLRPTFKRVEQGVSDTGPLRVGMRDVGVDLIVPTGFRDVFEIQPGGPAPFGRPGAGSFPGSPRQFARINGAVTAVFPRSIYTPTDDGVVAEIPPGTIFYVGGVPSSLYTPSLGHISVTPDGGGRVSPLLADSRADTSVHPVTHASPRQAGLVKADSPVSERPQGRAGEPSQTPATRRGGAILRPPAAVSASRGIMTDDSLRQRAVQALMTLAAAAEPSSAGMRPPPSRQPSDPQNTAPTGVPARAPGPVAAPPPADTNPRLPGSDEKPAR